MPASQNRDAVTGQHCADVATASLQSVEWLGREPNRVRAGQSYEPMARQLRKNARAASRLAAAANLPPSIAVYGASQAGKSYLIAHLAARPGGGEAGGQAEQAAMVLPHRNGGAISFLKINPGGSKESTGLVTRFTKRPVAGDPSYPVLIKLLTPLDLIKILASCYAVDLVQKDEPPTDTAAVLAMLDAVTPLARGVQCPFNEDDIFEMREVCGTQFGHIAHFKELIGCRYFEAAAPIAAGLDMDGIVRLFEPIWGSVPKFTALFRKLYGGLAALGFATSVSCPMGALEPRTDVATGRAMTIIDVETLKRLMSSADEKLDVRHVNGVARLDRPIITALAAELVLNLAGPTRTFLDQMDLLDFPGARSRGEVTRRMLDDPTMTEEVFLRGKVAHLFDRYRDEYDITSMILCIGNEVQEVKTLPGLITEWVGKTHGRTPTERQNAPATTLFIVLTKFDTLFIAKAGVELASSETIKSRLLTSFTNFLGPYGEWTRSWTPTQGFNNIFWYRNPFVAQRHIVDLENTPHGLREVNFRTDMAPDIAILRQFHSDADLVRSHFANPDAAWDAAMTLNDGGITYLAERLTRSGDTTVKLQQIKKAARDILAEDERYMRPLHFDTDPEAQRTRRVGDALKTARELAAAGKLHLFGGLLARLTVTPEELERLYRAARLRAPATDSQPETSPVVVPGSVGEDVYNDMIRGLPSLPGLPASQPAAAPVPAAVKPALEAGFIDCSDHSTASLDLAARFACSVYAFWSGKVHDALGSEPVRTMFGLSPDGSQTLATELIAGSKRIHLIDALASKCRPSTLLFDSRNDLGAPIPSLIAANFINDYVAYVGRRGVVRDPDVKVQPATPRFARETHRNEPELAAEPRATALEFCIDWGGSFVELVIHNASSVDGVSFDVKENDDLGVILKSLNSLEARVAALR